MRFIGEERARWVDALAACLEDGRHRMLREPVDLEVGMEQAQLVSDCGVTLGVAETDGRGYIQRALAAPIRRCPSSCRFRRTRKVAEQQVHLHGLTSLRPVPGTVDADERPAGELGKGGAGLVYTHGVVGSMNDEDRAVDTLANFAQLRFVELGRNCGGDECFRGCLESPVHTVLDLFRAVRFCEDLGEKEAQEVFVM